MIRQYARKKAKVAWGIYNTYIRKVYETYKENEWWDNNFFTEGISDRQTISRQSSQLSSMYHYCSVEMQILKHFYNNNISIKNYNLLDIGSGSGHWIDFYLSLGFSQAIGVDVSLSSVKFLKNKYESNNKVNIVHGSFTEVVENFQIGFNIINAIGVMFHIVDDSKWEKAIQSVSKRLKDNGLFIIGGHFGLLDNLNIQVDKNGHINKRIRSRIRWKNALKNAGFSKIFFYKNNAYLWINAPLPENNLIIAKK